MHNDQTNHHRLTLKQSPSILAQITHLPNMTIDEIKHLWHNLFNTNTPSHNRAYLQRRLAYRLQEKAADSRQQQAIQQNKQRIAAIIKAQQQPKTRGTPKPMPGSVLTRIYQDVEHQVTVTHDNQFEYAGKLYKSLSVIACIITGTHWSGPLFFGLRKQAHKNKTKRSVSK